MCVSIPQHTWRGQRSAFHELFSLLWVLGIKHAIRLARLPSDLQWAFLPAEPSPRLWILTDPSAWEHWAGAHVVWEQTPDAGQFSIMCGAWYPVVGPCRSRSVVSIKVCIACNLQSAFIFEVPPMASPYSPTDTTLGRWDKWLRVIMAAQSLSAWELQSVYGHLTSWPVSVFRVGWEMTQSGKLRSCKLKGLSSSWRPA